MPSPQPFHCHLPWQNRLCYSYLSPWDWMRGHGPICDNMLISTRARPSPDAAYPNSTKEETDSEGSRDLSPQGKPGLQARADSMCSCNTVSWGGHGSVVGNPKVPWVPWPATICLNPSNCCPSWSWASRGPGTVPAPTRVVQPLQ